MRQEYFKLRLEAKLKNGYLREAREKLHLSQAEVSRQLGINPGAYNQIECMRCYPNSIIAQMICDFYTLKGINMAPEDIFPKELQRFRPASKYVASKDVNVLSLESISHEQKLLAETIEKKIDEEDLRSDIDASLSILKKRDAEIMRMYFGLAPYDKSYNMGEIATKYNISQARIGSIKKECLHTLRKPKIIRNLRKYLG